VFIECVVASTFTLMQYSAFTDSVLSKNMDKEEMHPFTNERTVRACCNAGQVRFMYTALHTEVSKQL